MAENKAYAPPSKARMNVASIMAAIRNSGADGLQAANAFGNAIALSRSHGTQWTHFIINIESVVSSIVSALDSDQKDIALKELNRLQREVRALTSNLNRSLRAIESGIRWHTGLHKGPAHDPLYQR